MSEGQARRALVLGRGASGCAAADELTRQGFDVSFADGVDLVVASPGIPVKSELQLGCAELKRRGWRLLAVTGSKGKSSVVKLVADALNLAGNFAVPCGNYGTPVSALCAEGVADGRARWAVVEVSSFQLETTSLAADAFVAAAVLNLQEDHLDRHGDARAYHALKMRLRTMATRFFAPDDLVAASARADVAALLAGSYFDNEILRANGAGAVALLRAAGVDDAVIGRAFAAFKPLPHRMNLVADVHGVRCIDDSKATSVAALVAGLRMAGVGIRLIAGGLAKGDDPKVARGDLTRRTKKVYLIGCCAEKFRDAWQDAVDCEVCGTLEKAVGAALRDAETGETILLSPGTASFDQFKSFGERGETFARLVQKEREKK